MDWGIVTSIIVALILFVLVLMAICIPVFLLMASRMKTRMQTGNMPGCPMLCGPSGKNTGPAMTQCTSQIQ